MIKLILMAGLLSASALASESLPHLLSRVGKDRYVTRVRWDLLSEESKLEGKLHLNKSLAQFQELAKEAVRKEFGANALAGTIEGESVNFQYAENEGERRWFIVVRFLIVTAEKQSSENKIYIDTESNHFQVCMDIEGRVFPFQMLPPESGAAQPATKPADKAPVKGQSPAQPSRDEGKPQVSDQSGENRSTFPAGRIPRFGQII